jgi:hypothetical protein
MNKPLKITLLVIGVVILWGALASLNTGPIGLGVILSLLALLDTVTGEFGGNNKMVWLSVSLTALLFAFIGIGSVYVIPADGGGKNAVHALATIISILLPIAYFLIGRGQKIKSNR